MKSKNIRKTKSLQLFCLLFGTTLIFSVFIFWSNELSASASTDAEREFPNLKGREAVEHLQKQGVYESLQEVVKAARLEDELVDPQIKITAGDGEAEDRFGFDVAISGKTAVFGSPRDTVGTNDFQGSVYVFERQANGWVQQQKLVANPGVEEIFGSSVAIEGDTIVVGAPSARPNGGGFRGAGYVFTRSGTSWTQQQMLTSDNGGSENLGRDVAISGDTIVLGTDRGQTVSGRALVFVRSGGVWQEQQVLTASDAAAGDLFGMSIGISGDTIIVGAAFAVINGEIRRGAGYVFVRSGATWFEQQKLTAPDGQENDQFGISTTIDGARLAIGAPIDESPSNQNRGVYIFTRSGSIWTLEQKISPNDGQNDDRFSGAISLDGDNILIAASNQNVSTTRDQGAVYHFARSGTNWSQQRKLTASDSAEDDFFGSAVAMDEEISVIGAWHDDLGANADQGAGYIFDCSRTEQRQLLATDGAAFDQFGTSIAVNGDTVVVGAPFEEDANGAAQGAVYVFVRGGTGWIQQQKLKANPLRNNAEFGHSVDISGDTIVVGAWTETVGTTDTQGAAYVFVRNGTVWTQQAQLLAGDGTFNDQFGASVAIDGDSVVIGSVFDDVGTTLNQGSAYIFTRSGAVWTQQARINATDGVANDNFGNAVDISGETVLVGAYRKGNFQGVGYVFVRSGAIWSQQQKLTAADGLAGDEFGFAVSLDGDTAAIGAHKDDDGPTQDLGSVYVFTRGGTVWTEQTKIVRFDIFTFSQFGYTLALDGGNLVIGQGGGLNTAWVYSQNGADWTSLDEYTGTAQSDFGEAVGVSGATVVVGALAKNVGNNSQQGEAFVYYGDCSTAPVGTGSAPLSRRRCQAPTPTTLGTVSDAQEPAGNLIVTTQNVPAGITLTDLLNTNGTVTANVGAECSAALGAKTVVLKVSDAAGGVSLFGVTVNVIDPKPADFDGDGKSDIAIWRPPDKNWWILPSSNNNASVTAFGLSSDRIVPGDYDGDGKTDIAVFRPQSGVWYWLKSSDAGFAAVQWGLNGDIPAAGDFDGDGKTDPAVFRPSNGVWYVLKSSDSSFIFFNFGLAGDKPVTGDFDGDGKTDFAVFRPADTVWYLWQSAAGFAAVQFGVSMDKPVQADYDGDSKTDIAVYRPAEGVWYLLQSSAGLSIRQWGVAEDIPAPGDFDGDGKTDLGVFRPSQGVWYVQKSTGGSLFAQFGTNGDVPVEAGYFPQ
jgi:hypothetical protein